MQPAEITYRNVLTATVAADNSADAERAYNINAELNIRNGALSAVNNGVVSGTTDTGLAAIFSTTADGALNIQFYRPADNAAILAAVEAFLAAAHTQVATQSPLSL